MNNDDLNNILEDDLIEYAALHYYTPKGIDIEEFYDDLKRFKYVKRLLNRYYDTGDLPERLILNHLIVIFNVFGYEAGLKILNVKIEAIHWNALNPFLIFLEAIRNDQYTNIPMDQHVVEKLREIKRC